LFCKPNETVDSYHTVTTTGGVTIANFY